MNMAIVALLLLGTSVAVAETKAACIDKDSELKGISISDGKLSLCAFGSASDGSMKQTCFAIDVANGKWTSASPSVASDPPVVVRASSPKVTVGDADATICASDGKSCKKLVASGEVDPGLGLTAAADEALALGVLSYVDGTPQVETFDLASGRRISKFRAGTRKLLCVSVDVLGETLVVDEAECGTDKHRTWLATKKGKKVASVGGSKAVAPSSQLQLGNNLAAFSTQGEVVIQNLKTGKVTKRISLGKGHQGDTAIVGNDTQLVVVWGGGDIATVDVASGQVSSFAAPLCR